MDQLFDAGPEEARREKRSLEASPDPAGALPGQAVRVIGEPTPIGRLRAIAALRELLDQLESTYAARAREDGASWKQVGRALGISLAAAHRRHNHRRQ